MFTSVMPHPVIPAGEPQRSGLARFWHQVGPGSRRRHAHARAQAQRLAMLRHDWQEACEHVGLGLMMHTPSGVAVAVPRVGHADFGPPVSFTIALRPGQRARDVRAVAPELALALGVPALKVSRLAAGWATVLVTGPQAGAAGGDDGDPDDGDLSGPATRARGLRAV